MRRDVILSVLVPIFLLIALLTTPLAYVAADDEEEREAKAELEDPGNNAGSPTGVTAEIEFEDDGSTLKITGEAEGLTPGIPYGSLIYDIASPVDGPFACEPGIFDPSDPNFILLTMFVGLWDVDSDGEGELSATNIVDDLTGARVHVPLDKIATISIRDLTVPGPIGPGSGPAAVVACGELEVEDDDDEDEADEESPDLVEGFDDLVGEFEDLIGAFEDFEEEFDDFVAEVLDDPAAFDEEFAEFAEEFQEYVEEFDEVFDELAEEFAQFASPASGNVFVTMGEPTEILFIDGNLIISQPFALTVTGTPLAGTQVGSLRIVINSSTGEFILQAMGVFTGTVDGKSGTAVDRTVVMGVGPSLLGRGIFAEGTGDLVNLHTLLKDVDDAFSGLIFDL